MHFTGGGQQANQHAGQCGVHACLEHHDPSEDADDADRDPRHFFQSYEVCPDGGAYGDADEPIPGVDRGEEYGDQNNGQQVVDGGKRHQERADRTGQGLGEQGEHGQRERDIRGGGYCPAVRHLRERDAAAGGGQSQRAGFTRPDLREQCRDGQEQDGRGDHAAHRAQHRHGGRFRIGERAGGEFLLQFEAHGQEEDGKQTILGPMANRQVEIGVGDEQMRFRDGLERMRGGGQVREHQAGEREAEHDESGNTV